MSTEAVEPSSFRDPAGCLFWRDGVLLRQVNRSFEREFRAFQDSGLETELVNRGLLIKTDQAPIEQALNENAIAVLKPELLPFISYPYEWSFHALKDAALITLEIQKLALNKGMILRDASAYNIQFRKGQPLLIDSLSFGIYEDGRAWSAYRQYCQHFLAPVVLMSSIDPSLNKLSQLHIDGIPLQLAATLAPKPKFNLGLGIHFHTHAKTQTRAESENLKSAKAVSKFALQAWIDSLETTISKLEWHPDKTTWSNYYDETNYSANAMADKHAKVAAFLAEIPQMKSCWDLGANTGEFSALTAQRGAHTVAWDFDHACVDAHYQKIKSNKQDILPLVLDLTNPSPALGWANEERKSFTQRGPVDAILALAILHHLALANNLPFDRIAQYFAGITNYAIVEFVPKEDSQAQRLLENRAETFPNYDAAHFEEAFNQHFETIRKENIQDSKRILYLFKKRSAQ